MTEKKASVNDKYKVQSFIPKNDVSLKKIALETNKTNVNQDTLVSELLLELSEDDRKELLLKLFKQDIEELSLVTARKAEESGFQKGLLKAETQSDIALEKKKQELDVAIEKLKNMFNQMSNNRQSIVIDNEELIFKIIIKACFNVFGVNIVSDELIKEHLQDICKEYSSEQLECLLSKVDYELFHQYALDDILPDNFKVYCDTSLSKGSYKLSLSSGLIEVDIKQNLTEFIGLIDSLSSKKVGELGVK